MNLDDDFDYQQLTLKEDDEGPVSACFISAKANQGERAAVLYLHGFVDYFFHPHVAEEFQAHHIDFFALDLRKYGRAFMGHQHPNYCRDIREYYEEIDFAMARICTQTMGPVFLLGHSTGGLIASMYAAEGGQRNSIHALILNSPFFEFNLPPLMRTVLPFVSRAACALSSYSSVKGVLPPFYVRSLHKNYDGEWAFKLQWKPLDGFPVYYCWLSAIRRAQQRLRDSVKLDVPVLVMHSSHSFLPKEYTQAVKTADIILNIEDIKRIGSQLGSKVQLLEIQDAMHDIFLSSKRVRERAFNDLFDWLEKIQ